MMKRNLIFTLAGLALIGSFAGCSSDEASTADSTSGSATIASIADLPTATDKVVSDDSSVALGNRLLAVTGLKLSEVGDVSWDSTKARSMCENGRTLKDVYREASEPAKIQCYMGAMEAAGIVDLSDGEFHHYQMLNMMDEGDQEGGPPEGQAQVDTSFTPSIKTKVVKNADGFITNFVMQACFQSATQDMHIDQTLTADGVTINSVHVGSQGENTFGGRFAASGTLNADHEWISKTATVNYLGSFGDASFIGEFGMVATVEETADYWDIFSNMTGDFSGSFDGTSFSDSMTAALFSRIQVIGAGTSDVAMGDSSTNVELTHSRTFGGVTETFNDTFIESVDGDLFTPLDVASDGDFYSVVEAETLPTATTETVAYEGDEAWDCTAPDGFIEIDFSALDATVLQTLMDGFDICDGGTSSGDGGWVECHESGEEGGGEEQGPPPEDQGSS